MPEISLDHPGDSFPLTIGAGPSDRGPRLGGRAPAKTEPSDLAFRYFFSVPLPGFEAEEVSVFVHPSSDALLQACGALAGTAEVDVIRHGAEGRRDANGSNDSPITEHPLLVGEPQPDLTVEDGEKVPFSGHKMGGLPYFVHGEPSLEGPVHELLRSGYVHLVQIDFPGCVFRSTWASVPA
jgi:hypothetical protein